MATFGRFETVREIHRTGYTTVYSARAPESTAEQFVIKVFQPPALLLEEGQAKTEIDLFIKSTGLQQKVVARGAQHWAPIHQHGTNPEGAFYVTEKYEHSLQKLINVRLKLNSKILIAIVESVAKGLMELKESGRRPHGNLKATNVLIGGTGEISQRKIVLCDPLPDEHIDTKVHWDSDLQAIAELIYQLMVHQQSPRVAGWQAPDSKEWRSLGKQATSWRNLCNRLLNAHVKPGTITIEILLEELAQLKKEKAALPITWFVAAALIIVACTVAVVLFLPPSPPANPEEWKKLCDEYEAWIEPIFNTLDKERKERWGKNEKLKNIMDKITEVSSYPEKAADDEAINLSQLRDLDPNKVNKYIDGINLKKALADIRHIKDFFDPNSAHDPNAYKPWSLLVKIHKTANDFEKQGWKKPAAYLSSLVYSVRPEPNQPIAENVDKILDLKDTGGLNNIDSSLKQIAQHQEIVQEGIKHPVSGKKDPIFNKFNDHYVNMEVTLIAGEGNGESFSMLQNKLEDINDLGEQLAKFIQVNWQPKKVDQKAYFEDHGKDPVGTLTKEVFLKRLKTIEEYYYLHPDPRDKLFGLDGLDSRINNNMELALKTNPTEAGKCLEDYKKLQPNLKQIRKINGIEKNRDVITDAVSKYQPQMNELLKRVIEAAELPEDYRKRIKNETLLVKAEEISQKWEILRDNLLNKYPLALIKKDLNLYIELRREIDNVNENLVKLDEELQNKLPLKLDMPLKGTDWESKVKQTYSSQRKHTISRILLELTPLDDIPDFNRQGFMQSKQDEFEKFKQLRHDLTGIITAVSAIEDALDACYLLDDQLPEKVQDLPTIRTLWAKWKENKILTQSAFTEAFKTPFTRIKKFKDLDTETDRQVLTEQALATGAKVEITYAAWTRLGSLSDPLWPNDFEDVNKDRAIRATLKTEFKTISLKDEDRRVSLLETLAGTGLEREKTFIEENRSGDKVLAEFGKFTTPELEKLEGLAEQLVDFVSSEDWQKNKYRTDLFEFKPKIITMQTFQDWLSKIKDYRILEPNPRDSYSWVQTMAKIRTELSRGQIGQNADELRASFTDIEKKINKILKLPAIELNRVDIDKSRDYWQELIDFKRKLKPEYCKHLELSEDGQLVFATTTSLNPIFFKPVIKKDTDKFEPLTINSWDRFRTSNTLRTEFFYETEGDDNQNIGWPKYIRSTPEKDPSVIFRFIPAGTGNPEPFYIATHEITNAQYKLFLEKIKAQATRIGLQRIFLDQSNNELVSFRRREDQSRACKIEWDGTSFNVTQGSDDIPMTWVTYDGAKVYANWLGGQLPTVLQHGYACRAGTNTTYPWGNDPCQIPSYAHVAGPYWKEVKDEYNKSLNPDDTGSLIDVKPAPVGAIKPKGFTLRITPIDDPNVVHGEKVYGSAWPIAGANKPNAWDLYDMIGNVWEWCQDGTRTVICGGSCLAPRDRIPLEGSSNYSEESNTTDCDVGFRVIVLAPAK